MANYTPKLNLKMPLATEGYSVADQNGNMIILDSAVDGKVPKPLTGNGTNGQLLRTNGDGTTAWTTQGAPTDEQVSSAVEDWLDENVDPATGYVLDRTLSMSNAATPADITGSLKSALANDESVIYKISDTDITSDAIATGWKLLFSGLCEQNNNYKLVKYTVTEGTEYYIKSDDLFQFQNSASVPASGTPNRVGITYDGGGLVVKAPTGATHLIISTLQTGGTCIARKVVFSVADDIKGLGELSYNLLGYKNKINTSNNGITFKADPTTGIMKLNGTATDGASKNWSFGNGLYAMNAANGDTLTLSVTIKSGSYTGGKIYISLNNKADAIIRIDRESSVSFTYNSSNHTNLNIYADGSTVITNLEIAIQIEKGTKATPFHAYNSLIANDTTARMEISELRNTVASQGKDIEDIYSTEKYSRDFTVGTLSSGQPSAAAYRLRSKHFIPFDAFHRLTWDNTEPAMALIACYDSQFAYLGMVMGSQWEKEFTGGVVTPEDVDVANTKYIKFIYSKKPVGTSVDLSILTTNNVEIHMVKSRLNEYEEKIRNDVYWQYDARTLEKLCGANFAFGIQTDTHYNLESEPWYATSMKNLEKRINLDFIANLGDIIQGYENDTVADSYIEYQLAMLGLRDNVDTDTFVLMGNHDNNSMYAVASQNMQNAFYPPELFALFGRANAIGTVWGSREGLYGYKDYDRVRVVFLNTSDFDYSDPNNIDVSDMQISDEQLAWFGNTALNTDKPVLILSHAPLDPALGTTVGNSVYLIARLKEFTDGGGICIACVCGHKHSLNATVLNGVNHIVCTNGGDICEVFSVDLTNRTITTQQIGNNFTASRTFEF